MKIRAHQLTKEERIQTLDSLYTAAGTVKGRTAMKAFLRDLLTESERIMLGRRIQIARLLLSGSSYDDIATEMSVGRATIRRVHRWLGDQFPGYEDAIREMEKVFAERKRTFDDKRMYATSAMYRLKKKYPFISCFSRGRSRSSSIYGTVSSLYMNNASV